MQLTEALKYLKEKGLESDNEFMLGSMYDGDLFSLVKLTYEDDGEGDWWVAHLTAGYLNNSSGEEAFYSGESDDEILFEVFADYEDDDKFNKFKDINYKTYHLDEDVIDLKTEYGLYALFPDLPNVLVSNEVIPSKEDIAKFKSKAKEQIDLANKNK